GQGLVRVELDNPFEDLPGRLPRGAIRILVYVPPIGQGVRPYQQAKSLNHAVSAGAVSICLPHVFDDTGGLGVAEHAHAHRLDMTLSTPDTIKRVGLGAGPARKIKPSSDCLIFAVEELQQGYELVALDQDPGWVGDKQLAETLIRRVIRAITNRQRLLRLTAKINLDLRVAFLL